MTGQGDAADPRGVIREAYEIEGIGPEDCRSIFLDWALTVPAEADTEALIRTLLARHGAPEHPMTEILREGLATVRPSRRGGAVGRRSGSA